MMARPGTQDLVVSRADKIVISALFASSLVGGAVASWLVRSSTDRAVRVRALAGDTVLCSWARHFTLAVPLSTRSINGYR